MKDKQKLDLIVKRDQEMSTYIDRFEEVPQCCSSMSTWSHSTPLTDTREILVRHTEHQGSDRWFAGAHWERAG
jgi:hypothetical protein